MSLNIINSGDIDNYVRSAVRDRSGMIERQQMARLYAAQQNVFGGGFGRPVAYENAALPERIEVATPNLDWLTRLVRREVHASGVGVVSNPHVPGVGFFDTRTVPESYEQKLRHIADWLRAIDRLSATTYGDHKGWAAFCAESRRELRKLSHLSTDEASAAADQWFSRRDRIAQRAVSADSSSEDVLEVSAGLRWVRLTTRSQYLYEGAKMQHCVASYFDHGAGGTLYSLRDANDLPHATAYIRPGGSLYEAKGRQNHPLTTEQRLLLETLHQSLFPGVPAEQRAVLLADTRLGYLHDANVWHDANLNLRRPVRARPFRETNDLSPLPGTADAGLLLVATFGLLIFLPVVVLIGEKLF